jgi:hypothetical protein
MKVLGTLKPVALVWVLSGALAAAEHLKLVQSDIPNSTRTSVFGVNDSLVLTGTYRTGTSTGPRHTASSPVRTSSR